MHAQASDATPLRVGIDLTALLPEHTGVDKYLLNLVFSLAEVDRESRYTVFVNREDQALFDARSIESQAIPGLPPNFRVVPLSLRPRAARLFFQQVLQPAALRALRLSILHSPSFIMPLWRAGRRHVLTIHDMTSFTLPHCHTALRRSSPYRRAVESSIRTADLVSVPSPSVRSDVLRLVEGVREERIRVIASGVEDCFRPREPAEIAGRLRGLGIDFPYVLFVGTIEPRKNVARLIDGYARLVAAGDVAEHLVLAGGIRQDGEALAQRADAAGVRERVHFLGYVSDADLPSLYSGASLFVYPSLQEGFGFPPLEAMASGVPVIASLSSSMTDNLDGAAVLVPPEDVDGLARAMRRLLDDAALRGRLIREGRARARRFRWTDFARRTLDCYRELANGRGS